MRDVTFFSLFILSGWVLMVTILLNCLGTSE
jgi:hypothetical protein